MKRCDTILDLLARETFLPDFPTKDLNDMQQTLWKSRHCFSRHPVLDQSIGDCGQIFIWTKDGIRC